MLNDTLQLLTVVGGDGDVEAGEVRCEGSGTRL